jgi:pyruvate/2-oxoglutarate dehydrogenase complex dihydrolipoamide acyltransferase (E2) component
MMFMDIFSYRIFLWFAGTFTLSNLGMFGVDRFDAILPPGQVGSLSLCCLVDNEQQYVIDVN